MAVLCLYVSVKLTSCRRSYHENDRDCIDCNLDEMDYQFNDEPNYSFNSQDSKGACQSSSCNCDRTEPRCKAGVNVILDGCNCCRVCARQQGDLCSHRDRCDEQKGLYCDMKRDEGFRGICRAKSPRPCNVNGTTYKDGEAFTPQGSCWLHCTCQDGRYACTTNCPQELRQPSPSHCRDAQLVSIKGECCREWVCPRPYNIIENEQLVSDQYDARSPAHLSGDRGSGCRKEATAWSSCSVTCGMGESMRITNDNPECQHVKEIRLCQIRPCDVTNHVSGKKCRSTWMDEKPRRLKFAECESEELFQLKYCSSCRRHKCCGPVKAQLVQVQFRCPENKIVTRNFEKIKSCKCYPMNECPLR